MINSYKDLVGLSIAQARAIYGSIVNERVTLNFTIDEVSTERDNAIKSAADAQAEVRRLKAEVEPGKGPPEQHSLRRVWLDLCLNRDVTNKNGRSRSQRSKIRWYSRRFRQLSRLQELGFTAFEGEYWFTVGFNPPDNLTT